MIALPVISVLSQLHLSDAVQTIGAAVAGGLVAGVVAASFAWVCGAAVGFVLSLFLAMLWTFIVGNFGPNLDAGTAGSEAARMWLELSRLILPCTLTGAIAAELAHRAVHKLVAKAESDPVQQP